MAKLYTPLKKDNNFLVFIAFLLLLFVACNPAKRLNTDFNYFQTGLDSIKQLSLKEPTIKVNDQLSIQVYSNTLNQEQVALFNLVGGTTGGQSNSSQASATSGGSGGYFVNEFGDIVLPVIGKVNALGLTTQQLKETLIKKIGAFVKDPDVIVKFLSYKINVLGEVKSPGVKSLPNQRVTILDAISASGDLTDYGKREDILVLRDSAGITKSYKLDLRSATVFNSPAFQLQQNDIVYVKSNDVKLKSVTVNPLFQRDLAAVTAISSLVVVFATLYTLLRR